MDVKVKVLIAEESALDTGLIERAARACSLPMVFRHAVNRTQFLHELHESPDIILSNYKVSDLDGIEALRLSREITSRSPFIFVTSHLGDALAVACVQAGAYDYILKEELSRLEKVLPRAIDFMRNNAAPVAATDLSSDQFKRLTDSSRDLITVVGRDGKRVYTSPSYAEQVPAAAIAPEAMFFDEMDPEDLPKVKPLFYEIFETGQPIRTEYRISSKDGKSVYVESQWSPVYDRSEKPEQIVATSRVITRRKRAEDALKENIRHFRALVENISDVISLINPYGIILYSSRSTSRVLGYDISEFVGRNAFDLIHQEDLARAVEYFNTVQKRDGSGEIIHLRFHHKDGSWRWMEGIGNNLMADPSVKAIVFSYRDITEKKASEEALRQKDELFRALIENSSDAITLISAEGKILYSVHSLRGFGESENIGKDGFEFLHPQDRPRVRKRFAELVQTPNGTFFDEFRILNKDSSWRWNECVAKNLLAEPHIKAIVINSRDITDRKNAETALAEQKERLQVTLSSLGEGVITTDTEGRVMLVNITAEKILARSQKELQGQPIARVFRLMNERATEDAEHPVDRVLQSKVPVETGNYALSSGGSSASWRIIAANAAPILDFNGELQGVVMVFRDITDKLKMENELLKSRKIESIGVLAGGIAHDFNNILSAILGNISLAKAKINANNKEKSVELLSRAEKASERAKDLTQQLLTFSKGGAPVKKTSSIVDLLKESAHFSSAGSNVRCEFIIQENLFPIDMDAGQMSQVVNNLIINARQAMPEGGVIAVSAQNALVSASTPGPTPELRNGSYVKISIRDQGIGIPEEHLHRIFDPYFTTKASGNGLGLATSYSIIRNHEGAITVESKSGEGTVFHIYLPASKGDVRILPAKDTPALISNGRILVMDDEETLRELASNMLNHLGYEVTCAKNGEEALELYKKFQSEGAPFDAVIMDLTIPGGMGGKETMKHLLNFDPKVRAIVSSGYSNDPVMADHRKYGFKNILPKPYFISDLSKALQSMVVSEN